MTEQEVNQIIQNLGSQISRLAIELAVSQARVKSLEAEAEERLRSDA